MTLLLIYLLIGVVYTYFMNLVSPAAETLGESGVLWAFALMVLGWPVSALSLLIALANGPSDGA